MRAFLEFGRLVSVVLAIAVTSCATDRYHYALSHAYVTPWTHLPRSDVEQIIWVVSRSTSQPVVGVAQSHDDPGLVRVITALSDSSIPDHCTGLHLRKTAGQWRIVFQGSSSDTIAQLILTNPM